MKETFSTYRMKEKRLILILREPVAREFSLYQHLLRECMVGMHEVIGSKETPKQGWDDRFVNEICSRREGNHCQKLQCKKRAKHVKANNLQAGLATFSEYYNSPGLVRGMSFYAVHIKEFLKYFSRSQILILNF